MTDEKPKSTKRWRPRFSLLTALLLTALVACGITIWQLWHEIEPLRSQVRRMRTELGFLSIEDPLVAQAIQVGTGEVDHWKWRIYLPQGGKYELFIYSGTIPPNNPNQNQNWFDAVKKSGSGLSGTIRDGEFVFDVKLIKEGDRWFVATSNANGMSFGKMSVTGDWLSQEIGHGMLSSIASNKPSLFQPDQPILLMSMLEPVVTRSGNSVSWTSPTGPANGIVIWIEQHPPASNAKVAAP